MTITCTGKTTRTTTISSSIFSKPSASSHHHLLTRHLDEAGFNAELNNPFPQPIFRSINNHGKESKKQASHQQKAQQKAQYITPEHSEMIKYVQQTWKGVEQDYKRTASSVINQIDINNSSSANNQVDGKKPSTSTSTPLLLSGTYHHRTNSLLNNKTKDSNNARQDTFQPFDLEAFWGNRILKRLTDGLWEYCLDAWLKFI